MRTFRFYSFVGFFLLIAFSCKKEEITPKCECQTQTEPEEFITYPATGFHGPNILHEGVDTLRSPSSMRALIPVGQKLKFTIQLLSGSIWAHGTQSAGGVNVSQIDQATQTQTFESKQGIQEVDIYIESNWGSFSGPGSAEIRIYENNATTPTRTKVIVWED